MMIERLQDYQHRALAVMGRAGALIEAPRPDVMALAQCRWELARILRAYQIHKHACVFDPIIAADPAPDRVALARRLKADCIAMGARFQAHLLRWSATSVLDEWGEYRPATIALIVALRTHIDRERAGIAALEAGGAVPPPAAVRSAAPSARAAATLLNEAAPPHATRPRSRGL